MTSWNSPAFKPGDRIQGKAEHSCATGLVLGIEATHWYLIHWDPNEYFVENRPPQRASIQTIDSFYELQKEST